MAALLLLLFLDLSGTWKLDASRSESAHQGVPIGPVVLVIRQTPAQISIERQMRDGTEILQFLLNGSEATTTIRDSPVKTKARWEGPKLITETERVVNGASVTTRNIYTRSGKELKVEKMLMVQHGYQFPGARNYSTATDVFVRSAGH